MRSVVRETEWVLEDGSGVRVPVDSGQNAGGGFMEVAGAGAGGLGKGLGAEGQAMAQLGLWQGSPGLWRSDCSVRAPHRHSATLFVCSSVRCYPCRRPVLPCCWGHQRPRAVGAGGAAAAGHAQGGAHAAAGHCGHGGGGAGVGARLPRRLPGAAGSFPLLTAFGGV